MPLSQQDAFEEQRISNKCDCLSKVSMPLSQQDAFEVKQIL